MHDAESHAATCPLEDGLPETSRTITVERWRVATGAALAEDRVAEECPVALVFNGISHAVMMASPADLEEFATGFALSEGIVASPSEIHDLEIQIYPDGVEVSMQVAQPAFLALKDKRRTLTGRTGCGVCGTESLSLLDLTPESVLPASRLPGHAELQRALAELPEYQPLTRLTGCAHAAAWCSPQGAILRAFEDVGRHNALDKLLGWLALEKLAPAAGFVLMTSRASYELIRKLARRGVPVLATISAPTALAIRLAHASGITLLSFCRDNGHVAYPGETDSD